MEKFNRESSLRRGDAVLLTREATDSVLRLDPGASSHSQIVGVVMDNLSEMSDWEEVDIGRVWGVMVNGKFEQILDEEIDCIVSRASPCADQ